MIDLYQTHWPDPNTPQEETLEALDRVVKAGKVRFIGSSNQDTALLSEALAISKDEGLRALRDAAERIQPLRSRAASVRCRTSA